MRKTSESEDRLREQEQIAKEIRLTPRDQKEAKQRLYDNAMRMFAKHGCENITIDDICRETGVSKGAFSGLKSLVAEGVDSGEFKPELDTEKTANVLCCQCIGNLLRILSPERSVELEKLVSETIYGLDILCGSLLKNR